MNKNLCSLLVCILFLTSMMSCGVYSFTGASVDGKTIYMHTIENKAGNVVPTLSPVLTEKIRSRIVSQTSLTPLNNDEADYDISGNITGYVVTVTGATSNQTASKNRLTITVQINFQNRINPKQNFNQSFSRFADFDANQPVTAVENRLIEEISVQLAEDVFNKAFVNW